MENNEKKPLDITALTELEKAYLCFFAYTNRNFHDSDIKYPRLEGLNQMNNREFSSLRKKLETKGFLERKASESGFFFSSVVYQYEIKPQFYLPLLVYLIKEHSEWIKLFQSCRPYPEWHDFIMQMALSLSGEDVDFQQSSKKICQDILRFPDYCRRIIVYGMMMDGGEKMILQMPFGLVFYITVDALSFYEHFGCLEYLTIARKILDTLSVRNDDVAYLHAKFRRDWFYHTGEVLQKWTDDKNFVPDLFLEAAQLLYEGKTDNAIKKFEDGIKILNRNVKVKGLPYDILSLFLYVIALGIRRNADDIVTLQNLEVQIRRTNDYYLESVIPFVIYLKDSQQMVTQDTSFTKFTEGSLTKNLWRLFLLYVGEKIDRKGFDADCALLLNEMWGMGGSKEKGTMPYEPLLGRIKRREQWELKIEEIINKVDTINGIAKPGAGAKATRVMYYVETYSQDNDSVEVRIQKRLKNGNWGKGTVMSSNKWRTGDFDMDDIDKQVHDRWSMGLYDYSRYDSPDMQILLECCKGTDKLYTEYSHNYEYGPVEIIHEKPYIYTERIDGSIKFLSNIPEKCFEKMYKWSADRHSVTYWPLDEKVRDLYFNVLKLGSVPEKAEPMLEKMMERLKDMVEVQSDIEGAIQLEEREGNSTVIVRITRTYEFYEANIIVNPLENGDKYFPAGKGEENIVDIDGKTRYKVHRNIKAEKSNCKKVCDLIGLDRMSQNVFLSLNNVLTLLDEADEMKEVYCIEWPKGENLKIVKPDSSAWNINAFGKGGWFEVEGELRIGEDKVFTIAQLLELVRGGETGYVRLSDGEFLRLSKKIRSQLSQLDAVSQNSHGHVTVPELAMTFMKDAFDDIVQVDDYQMVNERRKLMREAAKMDFALPEGLNATLRPYQEEGYRWLMSLSHWGAGACLADDMGLGKTVQSIAFLLAKAQNGPQMVVAPTSVIGNWRKELARFSPGLRVVMLNELAVDGRAEALAGLSSGTVVVLSYGLLVTEKEDIVKVKWESVVLDEAHTIKNKETKMSSVAMSLEAVNKILLTGTPVQNHLGELWNLFRFINPGLLGSYEHFQEKFVNTSNDGSREALKRLVAPFLLRRTKNEVVRELPDKVEITIPVQFDEDEMAVYEVIRRQAKAELENGGPLSVNVLAMMTKLRMAACSAMLAEKQWKGGCSKLDVLIEKLMPIVESGNSVLVFSQFTSFLSMAKARIEREGITSYLYLDGSTPMAKRQKMVEQFQSGEQKVFLISLKAGGLGLNLTGANYVIHLDPWWNPAIEQQATDRAYRIGQQQKVTVYHLITENTIEEKILRLHDTKREMADSILEGRSSVARLTPEELMELIQE